MSRAVCDGCGRPETVCLCSHLSSFELPFRLIILQDPDESRHPLSTAPLLQRMARGSRLIVGDTFTPETLLSGCTPSSVALLYPSNQHPPLTLGQARAQIETVLVLDGTWRKVRRLMLRNPWLEALPGLALNPETPSLYLRKSPRADGLSTLEAVLTLADEWQPEQNFMGGVRVLERMDELQSLYRQTKKSPH